MKAKASKILVTVKTYPLESKKYKETVCTAGIDENGNWVRIYPISYRFLDQDKKFSKYQWIKVYLEKDNTDPRPESNKVSGKIILLNKIGTENSWGTRKQLLLNNIHYNMTELINEARDTKISTSLATFKPYKILSFKIKKVKARKSQRSLVRELPYKFYYTFKDELGKKHQLEIRDWEIYQLCRKIIRKYGNKTEYVFKILNKKYYDELALNRDLHFFLGTTKKWHIRRSRNPFLIIGLFYPPIAANDNNHS